MKIKYNNFGGYILVEVIGLNTEKFLNIASYNGIRMWDIIRVNLTTIHFKMNIEQYLDAKKISRKVKCKTKIIKKYGLYPYIWKLKRRKIFVVGLIVFFLLLLFYSSFILKVDVYGNERIKSQQIEETLREFGIEKYKLKYALDLREIENSMLKRFDDLAFIHIKYNGTRLMVEIVERELPIKRVDEKTPCDIIAKKDGIIIDVKAYKGSPIVKVGDFVKEGDKLISGEILDNNGNTLIKVHSMGDVIAKIWYEVIKRVPLSYFYEEKTGRVKKSVYISINGKKMSIKNDNIDFLIYDKIEEKSPVQIMGFKALGEIVTEYYYEKVKKNKILTVYEANNIAEKECENEINKTIPSGVKILDKKIEKSLENNEVVVKYLIITQEDIGQATELN